MSTVHSIHDILLELGTWCNTSDVDMMLAQKSGIDSSNNEEFADLVMEWLLGIYDDDIELLHERILHLVTREYI